MLFKVSLQGFFIGKNKLDYGASKEGENEKGPSGSFSLVSFKAVLGSIVGLKTGFPSLLSLTSRRKIPTLLYCSFKKASKSRIGTPKRP